MNLDSFYFLSFLWGGLLGSQACPASPAAPFRTAPTVIRISRPKVATRVTAFVDVNVVPMDTERMLPNQTVLIEGSQITTLGPNKKVRVPAGAVRIDGRGKYLIPGLADMHAHVPARDAERHLFSYLAHGVTTVRHLGTIFSQKLAHIGPMVPSPRLYVGAAIWGEQLTSIPPDSMAAKITAAQAAGYDYIMTWADYDPEARVSFDSLMAAAHRLGLPVASHKHSASFEETLAFGAHGGSVEHLYAFEGILRRREAGVSASKLQALAAAVHRAGTWITVTLVCSEYNQRPRGIRLALARRIVKTLQDAEVGLLLGSDANGGVGSSGSIVHHELAALVRAGLSPYQALRIGTHNVAQYFGLLDSSGTVAAGKWADLVLLSGNPLTDIQHTREPAGVMIGGQWFDRSTLDQGMLASPKFWFETEVRYGLMPRLTDEQANVRKHFRRFRVLLDSLKQGRSSPQYGGRASEHVIRKLTAALGAIRALLTPEQRIAFDPRARVWMREQARQGYHVTIPGVVQTR